jgi:hypothetical protein
MSNKENETKLRNYLNNAGMSKKSAAEQQRLEDMKKLSLPKAVPQADKRTIVERGKKNNATSRAKQHFLK